MTTQPASSQSAFSDGIYEASGQPASIISVHLTWGVEEEEWGVFVSGKCSTDSDKYNMS